MTCRVVTIISVFILIATTTATWAGVVVSVGDFVTEWRLILGTVLTLSVGVFSWVFNRLWKGFDDLKTKQENMEQYINRIHLKMVQDFATKADMIKIENKMDSGFHDLSSTLENRFNKIMQKLENQKE